jgi:hypothetical protein
MLHVESSGSPDFVGTELFSLDPSYYYVKY